MRRWGAQRRRADARVPEGRNSTVMLCGRLWFATVGSRNRQPKTPWSVSTSVVYSTPAAIALNGLHQPMAPRSACAARSASRRRRRRAAARNPARRPALIAAAAPPPVERTCCRPLGGTEQSARGRSAVPAARSSPWEGATATCGCGFAIPRSPPRDLSGPAARTRAVAAFLTARRLALRSKRVIYSRCWERAIP